MTNPLKTLRALLRKGDHLVTPPGRAWLQIEDGEALEQYLSVIPSQTSIHERMFLYFFAKEMVKSGNILELGPFLGGTTRAMARGIADSARAEGRLFTIDKFDDYLEASTFRRLGVPINAEVGESERVPFRRIFEVLHQNESYYPLLEILCLKIADLPSESTDYSFLDTCGKFGGVFIDGCKSWYSVKDFMANVTLACSPGAYFLFQDYGRYTCFWIPVFMELFTDHFSFVGSVEATYVFRMEKELARETIEQRYMDHPKDMDRSVIEALFDRICERADASKNTGNMVTTRIQAAAFHAYVGDTAKAKEMLLALRRETHVRGNLRKRVDDALVGPTYSPDEGRVHL